MNKYIIQSDDYGGLPEKKRNLSYSPKCPLFSLDESDNIFLVPPRVHKLIPYLKKAINAIASTGASTRETDPLGAACLGSPVL